jgi:proton-dependent oligopeptide transporter, POT family
MMEHVSLPKGVCSLCVTVGLERFAYYGLQSVLALYLAEMLSDGRDPTSIWLLEGLSRLTGAEGVALASVVVGLFVSLASIAPVIGALLADRLLGQHRAVTAGGLLMTSGHGLLILDSALLPALGAIALGSGLFKGPVAARLSGLYHARDSERVEGFRLFYIAINLGGLLAPLVIGTAGERIDWHAGFAIACAAMMAGLLVYWSHFVEATVAEQQMERTPEPSTLPAGSGILTIGILGISVAMICVTNFQIANAYLLWADTGFVLSLGQWRFPASWMIAADGVLSLLALGATRIYWARHELRHGRTPPATKAVIGAVFAVAGVACIVLAAGLQGRNEVPIYWGLAFQLLNSLGLANILPAVMAMFGQSSARRFAATAMAGFYLSLFAGSLVSTALASQFSTVSILVFWSTHALCAVIGASGLVIVWNRTKADATPSLRSDRGESSNSMPR